MKDRCVLFFLILLSNFQCSSFKSWSSIFNLNVGLSNVSMYESQGINNNHQYSIIPSDINGICICASFINLMEFLSIKADVKSSYNHRKHYAVNLCDKNIVSIENPYSFTMFLMGRCGGWFLLYDNNDSNSLYSGNKTLYFSGDPGVGYVYVFCAARFFNLKNDKKNELTKSIDIRDFMAGIGTSLFSSSSQNVHSVYVSTNIGASFYSTVYDKNVLGSNVLSKKKASPIFIFEFSVGKYINIGYFFSLSMETLWSSCIWEQDSCKLVQSINHTLFSISFVRAE